MIFVTRHLVKKRSEHADNLLLLFVNLKTAYESIPRNSLSRECWRRLVCLLPCFKPSDHLLHDGMSAVVRVGSSYTLMVLSKESPYTLAPTLFEMYTSTVIEN